MNAYPQGWFNGVYCWEVKSTEGKILASKLSLSEAIAFVQSQNEKETGK